MFKSFLLLPFYCPGATSRTCSIRLVLGSICWQLASVYGCDTSLIPDDYPGLVGYFNGLLQVLIQFLSMISRSECLILIAILEETFYHHTCLMIERQASTLSGNSNAFASWSLNLPAATAPYLRHYLQAVAHILPINRLSSSLWYTRTFGAGRWRIWVTDKIVRVLNQWSSVPCELHNVRRPVASGSWESSRLKPPYQGFELPTNDFTPYLSSLVLTCSWLTDWSERKQKRRRVTNLVYGSEYRPNS